MTLRAKLAALLIMVGVTLVIVSPLLYVIFSPEKSSGMLGSRPAPHDPNTIYSSIQVGEANMEYTFLNFKDCERFRSEMLTKPMNATACKLGSEFGATK
jgi:hypothetical protein